MASCADDEVLKLLASKPLPGRRLSAKQMWALLQPDDKSFIVHCLFVKRDVQDPNAFVCSFYSKLPQKPALPAQQRNSVPAPAQHRPVFKAVPAPWAWVMPGADEVSLPEGVPSAEKPSAPCEAAGPPMKQRHEIGTAVVGKCGGVWYPGSIVGLINGKVEVLWVSREGKRETAILDPDHVKPWWELVR